MPAHTMQQLLAISIKTHTASPKATAEETMLTCSRASGTGC